MNHNDSLRKLVAGFIEVDTGDLWVEKDDIPLLVARIRDATLDEIEQRIDLVRVDGYEYQRHNDFYDGPSVDEIIADMRAGK